MDLPAADPPLPCPDSPSSTARSVPPMFAKSGKALSAEERSEIARRRGVCRTCGMQTHKITLAVRRNLTNDEVYKGSCIRCERELIPPKVYSEWKQRHAAGSLVRANTGPAQKTTSPQPRHRKCVSSGSVPVDLTSLGVIPVPTMTHKQSNSTSSASQWNDMLGSVDRKDSDRSRSTRSNVEEPTVLTVFEATPRVYEDEKGHEKSLPTLDLDTESCILKEALKDTGIELQFQTATTNNLGAFLSAGKHQLLHLSCHGHQDYLFIENDYGGAQLLLVEEHLKPWIRTAGGTPGSSRLKFVFVSACHSRSAGDAFVDAGIAHVVCCEQDNVEVNNTAAMIFTRDFYRAIAYGRTLQQAFDLAIHAVILCPELKRIGVNTEHEAKKFTLLPEDADHNITLFSTQLDSSSSRLDDLSLSTTTSLGTHPLKMPCKPPTTMWLPPVPPQSFIGRELDMYRVLKALFVRKCRLVKIIGARGIGKAALAMAVGHYIAKRKIWGETLVWLPSARKPAKLESSTVISSLLELFAAFEAQDDDAINTRSQEVLDELYDTKAVIMVNTKSLSETTLINLSSFLDDVFERTKSVKVVLVDSKLASETIKSRNSSGFSCPEAEVLVQTLDYPSTITLFGKICQHASPCTWKPAVLHQKNSEAAYQVMGEGVPANIRLLAKKISRVEYDLLVEPGNPISCDDFRASLDSLPGNSDDNTTSDRSCKTNSSQATPKDLFRSQADVCDRFHPILKEEGKIYQKKVTSFIRRALKGENVVTAINGVTETKVTVNDDTCWVVCARSAGEHYVITDREFRENYDEGSAKAIHPGSPFPLAVRLRQEGYLEYRSRRRVLAHMVDEKDMKFFQVNQKQNCSASEAAFFMAPWNEPMRVEPGDYLAMTYPEADKVEVYRIERSAFGSTYVDVDIQVDVRHRNSPLHVYLVGAMVALLAALAYVLLQTKGNA